MDSYNPETFHEYDDFPTDALLAVYGSLNVELSLDEPPENTLELHNYIQKLLMGRLKTK